MITVAICDDNKMMVLSLIHSLKQMLDTQSDIYTFLPFSSGDELIKKINDNKNLTIDILFLDIEMDGKDGIETKDDLTQCSQVKRIVFISSHNERVFDAFGHKVVKFIPKPLSPQVLYDNIIRIQKELTCYAVIDYQNQKKNDYFNIVNLSCILSDGDYTDIIFIDGTKRCNIRQPLSYWESLLKDYPVVRISRRCIVSIPNSAYINSNTIIISNKSTQKIGRTYKHNVKKAFEEYKLNLVKSRML